MIYSKLIVSKRINKNVRTLGFAAVVMVLASVSLFIHRFFLVNGLNTIGSLQNVQIVNLTSNSVGVVWDSQSDVQVNQWVEWGESMNIMSHKSDPIKDRSILFATITHLDPDKTYYIRIRSYRGSYTWQGKRVIKVHTPKISQVHPKTPAYGKVILPSGRVYANGIIFFEVDGYVPVVTFTKETGEWLIPINGFVDKKTNTLITLSDGTKVTIRIPSTPNTTVHTTFKQITPLTKVIVVGSSISLAQSTQEDVLGLSTEQKSQALKQPSISYPKEGALIPGNTPLIKGTAVENKELNILIQGPKKQYSYRVVANDEGDWLVQYPLVLEPGKYVVSAITQDRSGFKLTLRRSFSIIKSGEQVLGEATGSPTLVPTSPPVSPPTIVPTQNILPTQLTSPSPIPTRFVPSPTPPKTGGELNGYLFTAVVCIVLGAGLVLVF